MSTITPHATTHGAAGTVHANGRSHGPHAAPCSPGAVGDSGFASLLGLLAADATADEALGADASALGTATDPSALATAVPPALNAMVGWVNPGPNGVGATDSAAAGASFSIAATASSATLGGLAQPAGLAVGRLSSGQNGLETIDSSAAGASFPVAATASSATPGGLAQPAGLAAGRANADPNGVAGPVSSPEKSGTAVGFSAPSTLEARVSASRPSAAWAGDAARLGDAMRTAAGAASGVDTAGLDTAGVRAAVVSNVGAAADPKAELARQRQVQALLQGRSLGMASAHREAATAAQSPWAQALAASHDVATEAGASLGALAAGWVESAAKPQERHTRWSPAPGGVDVVAGAQPGATARADGVVPVADVSAVVAPDALAETVSAWVAQGVHHAVLSVEGLGDDTLDVRIALAGDQAQVEFRSDVPELRQLIEATVPQLKERLAEQGVQLNAATVGWQGASAQTGQGGSGQPRPGAALSAAARSATEAVAEVGAAAQPPRVRGPERALDMFV